MDKDFIYGSYRPDSCPGAHPGPSYLERKVSGEPYSGARFLRREAFYLWMFISQEGLLEEAREYLEENMDHPVPFEYGAWL